MDTTVGVDDLEKIRDCLHGGILKAPEHLDFIRFIYGEPSEVKAVYPFGSRLLAAFTKAIAPLPVGYLPRTADEYDIVGYGVTSEGNLHIDFTFPNISDELEDIIQQPRFFAQWMAAGVKSFETSKGHVCSFEDAFNVQKKHAIEIR